MLTIFASICFSVGYIFGLFKLDSKFDLILWVKRVFSSVTAEQV